MGGDSNSLLGNRALLVDEIDRRPLSGEDRVKLRRSCEDCIQIRIQPANDTALRCCLPCTKLSMKCPNGMVIMLPPISI